VSLRRIVSVWLPFAVAATGLAGLIYVTSQQALRMGANDLPTQIAEDAAAELGLGAAPSSIVGSATVDISASLRPFVAVFAADGALLASSARLDDMTPSPPQGVLAAARAAGMNRVTWQPAPGVRMASVAVALPDGRVVVSGHSLRETEAHIAQSGTLTGLGWLATLLATLVATALGVRMDDGTGARDQIPA
jgi:hypothetical protein